MFNKQTQLNVATIAPPEGYKYAQAILIDDNRIDVASNKAFLRQKKITKDFVTFLNPVNALAHFTESHYANTYADAKTPILVFLDIYMPEMTGFEFLAHFEKIDPKFIRHFKIYLLSASTNPLDLMQATKCQSVYGFLNKPIHKNSMNF